MPMIAEDIVVGLQALSASDNMNDRQRTIMTEAAACIKFQQHRVSEAERKHKEADADRARIAGLNEALNIRTAGIFALNEYFRQQLTQLSRLSIVPPEENE